MDENQVKTADDAPEELGEDKESSGFRGIVRRLLQLDDTPESVARGVALGLFIAMTPTVGVQMVIVTIVNTICKANRLAGVLMVYVSNPLTMLPIYWFDYQVGRLILDQESISRDKFNEIFVLKGPNLLSKLQSFVENLAVFSWEVAGPLFLGGVVVGALCGLPAYPITLKAMRKAQAARKKRRARKQAERESKVEGESKIEGGGQA